MNEGRKEGRKEGIDLTSCINHSVIIVHTRKSNNNMKEMRRVSMKEKFQMKTNAEER